MTGMRGVDTDRVGTWAAGAVARRLGISPSTLRTWNHRYGIGPSQLRPGDHRRYSETDIAQLAEMQRLLAAGIPPNAAAEIAIHGPDAGQGASEIVAVETDREHPCRSVRGLERAAMRLDADALIQAFDASLQARGPLATWHTLCRPVLRRIERRVIEVGDCMDVEAVLTWAMLASLHRLPPRSSAHHPVALLACMQGEQHSLVLEVLHATLVGRGIACRILGPSVADSALLGALGRTRPAVVVLSSQQSHTARPRMLSQVASVVPQVIAAGPGWSPSTVVPANVRYLDDLQLALDAIDMAGTAQTADRPA